MSTQRLSLKVTLCKRNPFTTSKLNSRIVGIKRHMKTLQKKFNLMALKEVIKVLDVDLLQRCSSYQLFWHPGSLNPKRWSPRKPNRPRKSLPSDSNEHCDRINLLLPEKRAGIDCDKIHEGIIALTDKLLVIVIYGGCYFDTRLQFLHN